MAFQIVLAVFAATLIQAPLQSGGWYWDIGNALGLLGFAGLLYLFLDVGLGARQRIHQLISYAVTLALIAHAAWLWLPDPTIWHYLTWDGPPYMVAGTLALAVVLGMPILALPGSRRQWHPNHRHFKRWHYWFSVTVILASYWHIAGSGFYLSVFEAVLLLLLTTVVLGNHYFKVLRFSGNFRYSFIAITLTAATFVVMKNCCL